MKRLSPVTCELFPPAIAPNAPFPLPEISDDLLASPLHLWKEYRLKHASSKVGQIIQAAKKQSCQVDRLLVIAPSPVAAALQMMITACREPYFNQLLRSQRGSRPRIFLAGDWQDADTLQGLLELLSAPPLHAEDRLGVLLVLPKNSSARFAAVNRFFLDHWASLHPDTSLSIVRSQEATGATTFPVVPQAVLEPSEEELSPRHCLFTPAVLFPCSLLGMDIIHFLEGAAKIAAAWGENQLLELTNFMHWFQHYAAERTVSVRANVDALAGVEPWFSCLIHDDEKDPHVRPLQVFLSAREYRAKHQNIQPISCVADGVNADMPRACFSLKSVSEGSMGQLVQWLRSARRGIASKAPPDNSNPRKAC